ncbi:fluoride efflux transporter FluC [Streptomyces pacificus]|uniref:fluoride efflux transporter FluC n=1 Tax=Streptomyces pacificus TaxID=2705029 RepID=UPI001566F61B|nr:CrcB family protein [Streptomyces pacificus]
MHGRLLAAVALGGLLGGTARYGLALAFPTPAGTFPLTTFAVNVSGAFLLALLLVYLVEVRRRSGSVRPFAAVGFLGSYTTYSTWMFDTERLLGGGHCTLAVLNVLGSLLAGLAATALGLAVGRRVPAVAGDVRSRFRNRFRRIP